MKECTVDIVVNVSDAKISGDPSHALLTHALGSCIGVTFYHESRKVAGMLHFQLPSAATNPQRASENPAMFADTGLAHVLDGMAGMGADAQSLCIKVAGGAEILDDANLFNIGRRNYTAIRKHLWQRGLMISAEDIGGNRPRTLRLHVSDGLVIVKSDGEVTHL